MQLNPKCMKEILQYLSNIKYNLGEYICIHTDKLERV